MSEKAYFTVVFEGDIRKFAQGNPLLTETPFGIPVAIAVGYALAGADEELAAEREGTNT